MKVELLVWFKVTLDLRTAHFVLVTLKLMFLEMGLCNWCKVYDLGSVSNGALYLCSDNTASNNKNKIK